MKKTRIGIIIAPLTVQDSTPLDIMDAIYEATKAEGHELRGKIYKVAGNYEIMREDLARVRDMVLAHECGSQAEEDGASALVAELQNALDLDHPAANFALSVEIRAPRASKEDDGIWMVKQYQEDTEYWDKTFAVFASEEEAQKCADWHNKEYGQGDAHYYEIEWMPVKKKFEEIQ